MIKEAKRECWRRYCGKLGAESSVREVWRAVHHMAGISQSRQVPILEDRVVPIISDVEKANVFENQFRSVRSKLKLSKMRH